MFMAMTQDERVAEDTQGENNKGRERCRRELRTRRIERLATDPYRRDS